MADAVPAIHTLLLMDASSSIRSSGLLDALIGAANDALAELRAADCRVSIVYFNQDIGFVAWRMPASEVPAFSVYNVPIDAGTRLYDAILATVERLEREFVASHGETHADVRILIFTDGEDNCSAATGMSARLALGRAMERGFNITFVTAVPGLAGDLGLSHRQTVVVSADPSSVRAGFKRATMRMTGAMPDAAAERVRQEEAAAAPETAPKSAPGRSTWHPQAGHVAAPETAPQPAPDPGSSPPPRPVRPGKRPWWRFW